MKYFSKNEIVNKDFSKKSKAKTAAALAAGAGLAGAAAYGLNKLNQNGSLDGFKNRLSGMREVWQAGGTDAIKKAAGDKAAKEANDALEAEKARKLSETEKEVALKAAESDAVKKAQAKANESQQNAKILSQALKDKDKGVIDKSLEIGKSAVSGAKETLVEQGKTISEGTKETGSGLHKIFRGITGQFSTRLSSLKKSFSVISTPAETVNKIDDNKVEVTKTEDGTDSTPVAVEAQKATEEVVKKVEDPIKEMPNKSEEKSVEFGALSDGPKHMEFDEEEFGEVYKMAREMKEFSLQYDNPSVSFGDWLANSRFHDKIRDTMFKYFSR